MKPLIFFVGCFLFINECLPRIEKMWQRKLSAMPKYAAICIKFYWEDFMFNSILPYVFYYDSGFLVWNWVRIGWYMLLVFTSQFCKEFIFNVLRLLVGNFYIHVLFWQMCFSSIYHGIYVLCIFTYTWKNSNLHINYMYLNVELKL